MPVAELGPWDLRVAIQNALERHTDRDAAKIQVDVQGGVSRCMVTCILGRSAKSCSVRSPAPAARKTSAISCGLHEERVRRSRPIDSQSLRHESPLRETSWSDWRASDWRASARKLPTVLAGQASPDADRTSHSRWHGRPAITPADDVTMTRQIDVREPSPVAGVGREKAWTAL